MSDYLHLNVQPDDLRAMSSLALAHMGDAVYEILARGWLCTQGRATCGNLHKETVALVRAEAQAAAVEKLLPCYANEGKHRLNLSIGCTGGRHRSVCIASEIYRKLCEDKVPAVLLHRDIENDLQGK